mgnify:CR=1 FL=1
MASIQVLGIHMLVTNQHVDIPEEAIESIIIKVLPEKQI